MSCSTTLIGITGGIGMGKSMTSDTLRAFDCEIVDTDLIARDLVCPGMPCLQKIVDAFGKGILTEKGDLNRARLAELVFSNEDNRGILESILHPEIRRIWKHKMIEWKAARTKIGAVVIPLLYETQAQDEFDCILTVACSKQTQLNRLMLRGWSETHATQRIQAQMPIEAKMERADFIVWTEGRKSVYEPQIKAILDCL